MSKLLQQKLCLLALILFTGILSGSHGIAQTLISSIDGVYIETKSEFKPVSEHTIRRGDVIVFDIPGVYDFLRERGIPLKNVVFTIDGIELPEFPPYMWSNESGVLLFRILFGRLGTENRKILNNLKGGGAKDVLLGLKFDEQNAFTFSQPARIYFSNIAYWSKAGWILIIGFFLFFFILIIRFKSIIKDDVTALNTDGVISASYSLSKSQLAYWTFIITACFIYIWGFTNDLDSINTTALVLLGISAITTAVGTTINKNEEEIAKSGRSLGMKEFEFENHDPDPVGRLIRFRTSEKNFFRDILSDRGGD